MFEIKSIKLYFFSIKKIISLKINNTYFKSNFYHKKITKTYSSRFYYIPRPNLIEPLILSKNYFYNIKEIDAENLWNEDIENLNEINNLHSFLWLNTLDRKSNKFLFQKIIISWIKKYNKYDKKIWNYEILSKRIIAWASNLDIIFDGSKNDYKEKFIFTLITQINHLTKNIKNLSIGSEKIICSSAVILSGLLFKEIASNLTLGLKELEKISENFFDKSGFPRSRNPEELIISLKYIILIREWLKESQSHIPDFLDNIIFKIGNCYEFIKSSDKKISLFNGASEIYHDDYDLFLKRMKYSFVNKDYERGGFIKAKNKNLEISIDAGKPPPNNFSKFYQAGCLSFEFISNGEKIICNSGYSKLSNQKFSALSSSTAAHSTLYINNNSSCSFPKNKLINKIYGNVILEKFNILKKEFKENKNNFLITVGHDGYKKKFGYTHFRTFEIYQNGLFGTDELKKNDNKKNLVNFYIRFHIYPGIKIVKTRNEKSILLSLNNNEGWKLNSETNNFKIDKNIFFGKKNKIIGSQCVYMYGRTNEENLKVKWSIEKVS